MKISILDIGATTIDLMRASVGPSGLIKWGESQCFVRLGEGTLLSGTISPDAWSSALTGVESLLARARARGSDRLVAVATSVVREANNGPAFRATLAQSYGLDVRVLSSHDESTLAYRGARSALAFVQRPLLVVDLGGGCVNFATGGEAQRSCTTSLPLGTLRLLPAFSPDGTLSSSDARALDTLIASGVAPVAAQLAELQPIDLVFCSGAARSVRHYALRRSSDPGQTGAVTRALLDAARREMIGAPLDALLDNGARPEHADGLAIATTLMAAIMQVLAIDQAHVVDRGLREGVALEEYERSTITRPERPSARLK
jgi:exopolyphosphatase/guanosine-5'-triphosphate,3'-diphosphate pyrophosphatase